MALAAALFYDDVEFWLDYLIAVLAVVLLLWGFIHVSTQRPDAFTAIGGLPKQYWMAILGGLFAFNLLFLLVVRYPITLLVYIGLGASAYYLLETRRGLKDVAEGNW